MGLFHRIDRHTQVYWLSDFRRRLTFETIRDWDLGSLAAGASETLTVTLTADASAASGMVILRQAVLQVDPIYRQEEVSLHDNAR